MPKPPPPTLHRHAASGVERFTTTWSGHQTQHHAHPEYQVTLSVTGRGRCTYLGGTCIIPPGCLVIFHPGEPHILGTADADQPWSLHSLQIPARWFENGSTRPLLQPIPLAPDGVIDRAFAAVWAATIGPDPTSALLAFGAALRARPGLEPTDRTRSELVRRCLDHLATTLDRPVSCSELARLVRSTPATVRRALVAATGLPPHTWHLQRRVLAAKHQLDGTRSIADVALSCGFADQAHFTRHFTRLVGISPARYASGAGSAGRKSDEKSRVP